MPSEPRRMRRSSCTRAPIGSRADSSDRPSTVCTHLPPSGRGRASPHGYTRMSAPRNPGGASTHTWRGLGSGAARLRWFVLAPAGRVVLLHDAGRDAPALTDRQAVLLRPGPDITGAPPPGRGPAGPA